MTRYRPKRGIEGSAVSLPGSRRIGVAGFAVVMLGLATTGAVSQGKLDARYSASLAGVPIGRGAWVIDIAEDHFTAAASGMTTGLLSPEHTADLLINGAAARRVWTDQRGINENNSGTVANVILHPGHESVVAMGVIDGPHLGVLPGRFEQAKAITFFLAPRQIDPEDADHIIPWRPLSTIMPASVSPSMRLI